MNPNNDTPPKQSILEFLTYISRIIEYYLRAPSNTQMTLTPSQLKKYHFNIERLEKSRRIMEQREDSLNHVLKKVSEL